ncbi:MAG: superoxide dismutase, Ni [Proteobacteria bacterium]|nr:superoxide dismutase, Ni [Pseudomonadota bacterium]MBU1708785.1 superoxide dismutase, Ni [Pseudomonadota bacterium]
MKKQSMSILLCLLVSLAYSTVVWGHCEVPCGIYDDKMRIAMLREHADTIEKAMKQVVEIKKEKDHNANQLVRWVMNKEKHAEEFQQIVSQYFLTQRIKPGDEKYEQKLAALHKLLVFAMKCKQTTELDNVTTLRGLISDFEGLYFSMK